MCRPRSPRPYPCNELKTVKANDLIIVANGDFKEGVGGYPFSHGVGCYSDDPDAVLCDWKVELGEDRMMRNGRRLIVFDSNHETGVEDWSYVYIFGCVAGQVRTGFGSDFRNGAAVTEPAVNELIVSTFT